MRGSDSSLGSASAYLGWLWFGGEADYLSAKGELKGNQFIQCVHAATSTYRPPELLYAIARKSGITYFRGSQPAYLLENPSFVKRFLQATPWYTLGSSVSSYGGWTGSTSQIIPWKLVLNMGPERPPAEVVGNGMFFSDGPLKGRDPFTQVVQQENVLIQMTCMPKHARRIAERANRIIARWNTDWHKDFVRRFPNDGHKNNIVTARGKRAYKNQSFVAVPEKVRYRISGETVWLLVDSGYVAMRSLSGAAPEVSARNGRVFFVDKAEKGRLCGFAIEVLGLSDLSAGPPVSGKLTVDRGTHAVEYTAADGTILEAQYRSRGCMEEAISDWGYGKMVPDPFLSSPPLRQPDWPSGYGWGKVPSLRVNGVPVNFGAQWPVWFSRSISLRDGVLTVNNGSDRYRFSFQDVP